MNWVVSRRKGADKNEDWLKLFDVVSAWSFPVSWRVVQGRAQAAGGRPPCAHASTPACPP